MAEIDRHKRYKKIKFVNGASIEVDSENSLYPRIYTGTENGLQQTEYSFGNNSDIYGRIRTRSSINDSWGSWGNWVKIAPTSISINYPKVYHGVGQLINGSSLAIAGYGTGTLTLYETGIARLDFVQTITTADSSTSNFKWGINRNLFNTFFGTTIPTITPNSGYCGTAAFYKSNGTTAPMDVATVGNGGTFERPSSATQFWTPARNYNTSGNRGAWPPSQFPAGTRIVGTCWGTFSV